MSIRRIDRSRWPAGPWDCEPDRLDWTDAATGLDCLALRHPSRGHWCGYVAAPTGHPLFGNSYGDSFAEQPDGTYGPTPGPHVDDLDVHGGITYAAGCEGEVCHVADAGAPPVWWLGFDCCHYLDTGPLERRPDAWMVLEGDAGERGVYRTLDFVRGECKRLAQQIAAGGAA